MKNNPQVNISRIERLEAMLSDVDRARLSLAIRRAILVITTYRSQAIQFAKKHGRTSEHQEMIGFMQSKRFQNKIYSSPPEVTLLGALEDWHKELDELSDNGSITDREFDELILLQKLIGTFRDRENFINPVVGDYEKEKQKLKELRKE